ncbi:MAG: glycosyltransferase family 9 protein [Desulfobacterales bacterium]
MKKKLLIIHQGALGDVITTFPSLIKLKNNFRPIHLLCQDQIGKLARDLGLVQKYLPLESAVFASLYSGSSNGKIKEILSVYVDVILFSYSAPLEKRIYEIIKKKVHRIAPRPSANHKLHVAEHVLKHLIHCGLLEESRARGKCIKSRFVHGMDEAGRSGTGKILIHPGAGSRDKLWPLSNFIELEKIIRSYGMQPEFVLGPADFFLKTALKAKGRHQLQVHTLFDLTALLTLLKRAGGFIGNDAGISHLSAFIGVPTVAIFGPSDPQRWRPVGRTVRIVRPDIDCAPCFEIENRGCREKICLTFTKPQTVMNALNQVISDADLSS